MQKVPHLIKGPRRPTVASQGASWDQFRVDSEGHLSAETCGQAKRAVVSSRRALCALEQGGRVEVCKAKLLLLLVSAHRPGTLGRALTAENRAERRPLLCLLQQVQLWVLQVEWAALECVPR